MALVTHQTRREPIPHEPGEWIEFKMPNYFDIQKAKRARSLNAMKQFRETRESLGDDYIEKLRSEAPDETALTLQRDPANDYDAEALLALGIAAWSYAEPCDAAHIHDLDLRTADWAFRRLAQLCENGFQEPAEPRDVIEIVRNEPTPEAEENYPLASAAAWS